MCVYQPNDKMYTYQYPHPALTADCVIFGFEHHQLHVLLIERGIDPFKGSWALPGGFIHEDETIEQCAWRELKEETNLTPSYLEQIRVFSRPDRDPRERVVTVAFLALVRTSEVRGGDDAARAQWFPVDSLPELAFDHQEIIDFAMANLAKRLKYEPVSQYLMNEQFTLPELQNLYETVLKVKLDRRNFQKKMISSNQIKQINKRDSDTPTRYPNTFVFNNNPNDE